MKLYELRDALTIDGPVNITTWSGDDSTPVYIGDMVNIPRSTWAEVYGLEIAYLFANTAYFKNNLTPVLCIELRSEE